ncbi:MAG TPA: DAK2 domain-containing protein [Verrucomicrobiae bacterium]|nr:DAK2 domain-containing protein [Verrucomicrobiae bacterium]
MLIVGSQALEKQKQVVDALNVFPVPDGDTGTNMHLTVQSAAREVSGLKNPTVTQVAAAASMGSLMGARGNSGVILSQLFRGLAKGLEGKNVATAKDLAAALQNGVDTAYKAVMKPVEGTILTVSRETAKGAQAAAKQDDDVLVVLEKALRHGLDALEKTPDLLPTLKQAGVVDAGGKGFLVILEGWIAALGGQEVQPLSVQPAPTRNIVPEVSLEEIVFQYCTEFIVKGSKLNLDRIKGDLIDHGDCLLVVGTEDVAKIHIHTNHPGRILEYCVKLGDLHQVQIHNMREQSEAKAHAAKEDEPVVEVPQKEIGIVAIAVGDGLVEVFRSLGVDEIIHGGQTMNPSTEDLVSAINRVPAKQVFILPNNGNIILAAQQAKTLVEKQVHVVPTKSIPQGIAATLAFDPEGTYEGNAEAMDNSFGSMKSGEVTYAVRDSQFDGHEISAGDILGLIDDKISLTGQEPVALTLELVDKMGGQKADLISVFYGQDVEEGTADRLADELRQRFPKSEVEVHRGGQPLYYYIISVE